MTNKQQELMDAMENCVECMRESGKMYEIWSNLSPEVQKAVTVLTHDIKIKSLEVNSIKTSICKSCKTNKNANNYNNNT